MSLQGIAITESAGLQPGTLAALRSGDAVAVRSGPIAMVCLRTPKNADAGANTTRDTAASQLPTAELALAIQQDILRLHLGSSAIPMRFGSTFETEADARKFVTRNAASLAGALDAVRGSVEFTLRVTSMVPEEETDQTNGQPNGTAETQRTPGTSFLLSRRAAADAAAGVSPELRALADSPLLDPLRSLASAWRCETSPADTTLGRITALVTTDALEDFAATFAQLEDKLILDIALSGPWSPASFLDKAA